MLLALEEGHGRPEVLAQLEEEALELSLSEALLLGQALLLQCTEGEEDREEEALLLLLQQEEAEA